MGTLGFHQRVGFLVDFVLAMSSTATGTRLFRTIDTPSIDSCRWCRSMVVPVVEVVFPLEDLLPGWFSSRVSSADRDQEIRYSPDRSRFFEIERELCHRMGFERILKKANRKRASWRSSNSGSHLESGISAAFSAAVCVAIPYGTSRSSRFGSSELIQPAAV